MCLREWEIFYGYKPGEVTSGEFGSLNEAMKLVHEAAGLISGTFTILNLD